MEENDHGACMRKAALFIVGSSSDDCFQERLSEGRMEDISSKKQEFDALTKMNSFRDRKWNEFWSRVPPSASISGDEGADLVEVSFVDSIDANQVEPEEFVEKYQEANLPCLVRGLESYFQSANQLWRRKGNVEVHRSWFTQTMGNEKVPVRFQEGEHILDEQGRAPECKTLPMTVAEWVKEIDAVDASGGKPCPYLKDFHLQLWLENHRTHLPSLYEVPPFFSNDLLNPFLLQFTDGDYRFFYWGPSSSSTELHSDVMNSFSWSYNVQGVKEWEFYGPENKTVRFIQRSGECVFVPSTWRHRVVNLEETLSINHNWISHANLDLVWACIRQEIIHIEKELLKWSIDDIGAKESMLRGCLGIDVTSFVLMVLVRIRDMTSFHYKERNRKITWKQKEREKLNLVLIDITNRDIDLRKRLEAVLVDQSIADQVYRQVYSAHVYSSDLS